MQYSITVNQLAYQTHFPDLNLSHAAIVDWFSRFTHSKKVSRLEHKGKTYYWLKYDKANSELPMLGLSHPDSMRRLVKALCTAQILEAHPDNQKGRSYFAFGDRYELTHSIDDLVHPGTGSTERSCKNVRQILISMIMRSMIRKNWDPRHKIFLSQEIQIFKTQKI